MNYIEIFEILEVKFQISLRCYYDVPVEEWTAKCDNLKIEAKGKTSKEARENLIKLIEKTKFKICD